MDLYARVNILGGRAVRLPKGDIDNAISLDADPLAEPQWVMAFGACTCSGGPYNNYATVQGIDTIIPVEIYVPGCPPRPEAVLDGLMKLQARVQEERVPADGRHKEIDELFLPVVEKPVA